MLQLAVCDDNRQELAQVMALLGEYQTVYPDVGFEIHPFQSAFEMLAQMEKASFDAMLLDVYMPGLTGIQAAKELRGNGFACPIVFLTSSSAHALEAFEVKASQYLVKPYTKADFFQAIDTVVSQVALERRRYILLKEKKSIRRVAVRDIVCCEAKNNDQLIQLVDGSVLQVRITLTELYQQLSAYPDFVRCGKAFVVNLIYVRSISHKQITLQNGKVIFLPRGSYAPLKEQYFAYYSDCEEMP